MNVFMNEKGGDMDEYERYEQCEMEGHESLIHCTIGEKMHDIIDVECERMKER